MAYRQKTKPNLALPAWNDAKNSGGSWRGWCLKYCDDGINAPGRQPNAQTSWNVENRNTNTRTGNPPVKVWTPIFLSFGAGAYKGVGHVAWAYNRGDGTIDIVDSEVHSGARAEKGLGNYQSIQELLNWFSAYKPKYLGWSLWLDGRQVVEEYKETKPPTAVETIVIKIGDIVRLVAGGKTATARIEDIK